MYEGNALDHGWLRHCAAFDALRKSAFNERLAEVYLRDALAVHPWRTWSPVLATVVYVPLWEVTSFSVGECNGTTHSSADGGSRDGTTGFTALQATGHRRSPRWLSTICLFPADA